MVALRQAIEGGYRDVHTILSDNDLDSLRSRPDFQQLIADLTFPDNPFAK
jgi:hypothetical protein